MLECTWIGGASDIHAIGVLDGVCKFESANKEVISFQTNLQPLIRVRRFDDATDNATDNAFVGSMRNRLNHVRIAANSMFPNYL